MRSVTAAVAALVLLAGCAGPTTGPDDAGPGAAQPAPDDAEACVAPATPALPVGTAVDLAAGRSPTAVGSAAGVRDVAVIDLRGGGAPELADAVAAALDPCADGEAVRAAGTLAAHVVAAALASAEGRTFVPQGTADPVADPAAGAAAAVAATRDLMARWGAASVLVVDEDDHAAWSTLVVEATPDAVPLVLASVPPAPTTTVEAADDAAGDAGTDAAADAGTDAADGVTAPPPADPALAALALLPADATLTVVGSDEARTAALAARLVAVGRPDPAVRVLAAGVDAAPAGWDGTAGGTLWLADPGDPLVLVAAAAAAGARDESLLALDPGDAAQVLAGGGSLRRAAPARLLLAGAEGGDGAAATTAWALDVALHTEPLPWGGWLPLDGTRIVALYGTPGAPALGALGQQDLDATIARVRETAARYDLDGLRIVPGFDVITTVASAEAGAAGDYSRRIPIERLRPLVDRARDEGMAVFIDLQPGRTDFLVQAQEYEELLLEPHVFLALDPEWRLRPDQVHLRQIGSVEAAEVQRVADWLAELVRRERLPQKAFMLHQFLLSMLPDRDTVVVPPELVGVVHVDGQGAVATKERTFRIMAEDADPQWRWGWKQFLRIDTPAIMDPADVIDRTPLPVVITYQ